MSEPPGQVRLGEPREVKILRQVADDENDDQHEGRGGKEPVGGVNAWSGG